MPVKTEKRFYDAFFNYDLFKVIHREEIIKPLTHVPLPWYRALSSKKVLPYSEPRSTTGVYLNLLRTLSYGLHSTIHQSILDRPHTVTAHWTCHTSRHCEAAAEAI